MTNDPSNGAEREQRWSEVLVACLEEIEAGHNLDRQTLLARYPEFAAELGEFLEHREQVDRLTAPLRTFVQATRDATPLSGDNLLLEPQQQDGSVSPTATATFGDFRILREVGRGGMGLVYEAEQISLCRRVALKVLPFAATMDSRHLQRFQNEARAAASLEHPHIVPVYGVGCERGVHFYAMKFIDGQTLAALIASQKTGPASGGRESPDEPANVVPLNRGAQTPRSAEPGTIPAIVARTELAPRDTAAFRQIAEWGIQAAEALEHAHSFGIVHRDIKPANLMIDGQGNLWVTDFGLARVGADAGLTMTGDVLGTLRYMSPEQAASQHGTLDHRTDVYSLGVTLFELLALEPPFDSKDRQELLRQIAFEEPRIPRWINKSIPHELETIVLKAMEKAPADRYDTPKEMAEDLQRFLGDVPIQARRPSLLHRTRKWCRRHQAVVWSAAIVLALGVLMALASLGIANQRIAHENDRIGHERDDARAQRKRAREAVDTMYTEVAEKWMNYQPGMEEQQRKFLTKALEFYKQFAHEQSTEPEHFFQTAMAYQRVAKIQLMIFKENSQAEEALVQAILILKELFEDLPSEPAYKDELAQCYFLMGWAKSAQVEEEEKWIRRGVSLWEELVTHYPSNRMYRMHLGRGLLNLANPVRYSGRRSEAEKICRHAIAVLEAMQEDSPLTPYEIGALATSYDNLAESLVEAGRLEEALECYRTSIGLQMPLTGKDPDLPDFQFGMSPWSWMNFGSDQREIGNLLRRTGKFKEARPFLERSLRIFEGLVSSFPKTNVFKGSVSTCYWPLGDLEWAEGRRDAATIAYQKALDILEIAGNRGTFAKFLLTCRDSKFRDPQRALNLLKEHIKDMPKHEDTWKYLAQARYCLGKHGAAVEAAEQAKRFGGPDKFSAGFIQAMAYWQLGEKEKARQCYQEAADWLEKTHPGIEELCLERDEAAALLGIKQAAEQNTKILTQQPNEDKPPEAKEKKP
ncbi:MAG: protein kinase domain-containing protein [Gemmataceae bacterium]